MNNCIQFELWKDCNNNCSFCFNKGQPSTDKVESLQYILSRLSDEFTKSHSDIAFIGGEFFSGQLSSPYIKELFYRLFEDLHRYNNIYLATSLIFNLEEYMIEFLEYIKKLDLLDKLVVCTSYDTIGRFNSSTNQLWKDNMIRLKSIYPGLRLHTEIILTGDFISKVNNEQFNIAEFKKSYSTEIDYLEPTTGLYYSSKDEMNSKLGYFFPKKSDFIKFLVKEGIENRSIDLDRLLDFNNRANDVYYRINNSLSLIKDRCKSNFWVSNNVDILANKVGFIDSPDKMVDVVRMLR